MNEVITIGVDLAKNVFQFRNLSLDNLTKFLREATH
jgi:hypothetical protein